MQPHGTREGEPARGYRGETERAEPRSEKKNEEQTFVPLFLLRNRGGHGEKMKAKTQTRKNQGNGEEETEPRG